MRRPLMPFVVALLLLPTAGRTLANPAQNDPERHTPIVQAVEKAAPAVVNISTTKLVRVEDPFFRRYYSEHILSIGSGVIVNPDGYVVTNSHVVHQGTKIMVSVGGSGHKKTYPARLLADDPKNDLALLKIDGDKPFSAVTLGRSDDLMIGEPAIAVGNPFAVGKTVTTGVVSAVNREVDEGNGRHFKDFIQTDAAINPGNSGGALLNIHGEMIGVNTAIIRGAEGIGFAIPVDRVKHMLPELVDVAVEQAHLGFVPATRSGHVIVENVQPDGVAAKAGLKAGDLIDSVEGRSVKDVFDFATPILSAHPGDRLSIRVGRSGQTQRIAVVVPMHPEQQKVEQHLGIIGKDASSSDNAGSAGVMVEDIQPKSPAARIQVQKGDVIVALGGYRVRNMKNLASLLDQAQAGATLDITVVRNGRRMTGAVTVR